MQLSILFAVLPIIARAAPLGVTVPGVGSVNIPAAGGNGNGTNIKLPVTPQVPAPVSSVASSATSSVSSLVAAASGINPTSVIMSLGLSATAGVNNTINGVAAAGGAVVAGAAGAAGSAADRLPTPAKNVVQSAASTLSSIVKDPATAAAAATGVVNSTVSGTAGAVVAAGNQGLAFVGNNLVDIQLDPGVANVTGDFGGQVKPISTMTPSDILQLLAKYIAGIPPLDTTAVAGNLTMIGAAAQFALQDYVNNAKDHVNYRDILLYVAQLIDNTNTYLLSLPANVAGNANVVTAAGGLDSLLNTYLTAAKTVGVTTLDFANAMYQAGLQSGASLSVFLGNVWAVFPQFPAVIANF